MDDSDFIADDDGDQSFAASQKDLNECMLREGDVEVSYAPVLPFLQPPSRAEALRRPFKLPSGAVKTADVRKSLGARRRKSGSGIGAFKKPEISQLAPPPFQGEEEDSDEAAAAPPPPSSIATTQDFAFEPLVLWETEEGVEPAHTISVDPILCKFLREHQREGVQFVFDCVTGAKGFGGNGCILAGT